METPITLLKVSEAEWLGSMDFDLGKGQRITFLLLIQRQVEQRVADAQIALIDQLAQVVQMLQTQVPARPRRKRAKR